LFFIMRDLKKGGLALIIGTVSGFITMVFHPTGHDLLAPERFTRAAYIVVATHSLALLGLPVLFLGALAIYRRVDGPNRLGLTALVIFGFGLVAGMAAAVFSGFVGPALAAGILKGEVADYDNGRLLFYLNGQLNRAFAQVFVFASALAISLWSLAGLVGRRLPATIGIFGLLTGVGILVFLASGYLRLDIHGFGAVMLINGIWNISTGSLLWKTTGVETSVKANVH
jgi:hypothetical protein